MSRALIHSGFIKKKPLKQVESHLRVQSFTPYSFALLPKLAKKDSITIDSSYCE